MLHACNTLQTHTAAALHASLVVGLSTVLAGALSFERLFGLEGSR